MSRFIYYYISKINSNRVASYLIILYIYSKQGNNVRINRILLLKRTFQKCYIYIYNNDFVYMYGSKEAMCTGSDVEKINGGWTDRMGVFGERENEKQGRFLDATFSTRPVIVLGTKRAEISRERSLRRGHTPAVSRARREIEMVSRELREARRTRSGVWMKAAPELLAKGAEIKKNWRQLSTG